MKKKAEPLDPVNTTVAEGVKIKFDTSIQPLDLSLDFGRNDLNEAVGKIQDKINELIKKQ